MKSIEEDAIIEIVEEDFTKIKRFVSMVGKPVFSYKYEEILIIFLLRFYTIPITIKEKINK